MNRIVAPRTFAASLLAFALIVFVGEAAVMRALDGAHMDLPAWRQGLLDGAFDALIASVAWQLLFVRISPSAAGRMASDWAAWLVLATAALSTEFAIHRLFLAHRLDDGFGASDLVDAAAIAGVLTLVAAGLSRMRQLESETSWQSDRPTDPGRAAMGGLFGSMSLIALLSLIGLTVNIEVATHAAGDLEARSARQGVEPAAMAATADMLVLLSLLACAVGVGLPTRNIVRNQQRVLLDQARDLSRLTLVARNTKNGVLICDAQRRIIWCNAAFEAMSGYTVAEAIGKKPGHLLQFEQTDPQTIRHLHEALSSGQGAHVQILNRAKDGRTYWLDLDIQPTHDEHGRHSGFIGVEIDITSQVNAHRRLAAVLDGTGAGTWDWDLCADRMIVDARWADISGHVPGPDDAIAIASWRLRVHPEDLPRYDEQLAAHFEGRLDTFACDIRVRRPDGDVVWVHDRGRVAQRDRGGRPLRMLGTRLDITRRKDMELKLRAAATSDALTGLANRALLVERLEAAVARTREGGLPGFAVLFLDLDRFKFVNDTLGHQAGDELLMQIAERLRRSTRSTDMSAILGKSSLTARFGGDEFVILLDGIDSPPAAVKVAERLLGQLRAPFTVCGHQEIHLTASIGIVTSDLSRGGAETILRDADTAMYEAKREARGGVVLFDPAMHKRLSRRFLLEGELRKAIGTDQMSVAFQPIVGLIDGAIASAEALVRWVSPTLGAVSPAEFVPVAEDSGLIGPLDRWVLREACRQWRLWQQEAPDLAPKTISVNLSRVQLGDPEQLLRDVERVLAENGMPPSALQLEVTEREVMRDPASAQALMKRLRALGVRLAMDDFGTGTSSLACLLDYPFDTIKIDRAFIKGLSRGTDVLAVVHATVTLAEKLGKTSVAEGVETPLQVAALQSIGCRFAQGYLFGRPVPGNQMLGALERLQTQSGEQAFGGAQP